MLVGGLLLALRARGGTGHAFRFVQEGDFQVAVVIWLAAAKLAEPQDDEAARLSFKRPAADERWPVLFDEAVEFQPRDMSEARFGDVG